jgi:uncharacterized protein (TIGR03083 family)
VRPVQPAAPSVSDAIARRTDEIVAALSRLSEGELDHDSELPGWSRLTIACHLRYGAEAVTRMSSEALGGRPTSYYPGGREAQRASTLAPAAGESAGAVVEDLGRRGHALHALWSTLSPGDWATEVTEPAGAVDLGPVTLERLALLRLSEVEVHGTDLGLGLDEWSELFVSQALRFRLEWLNHRRANHRTVDGTLQGSWLLVATDGPAYRVSVAGTEVTSLPADPDAPDPDAPATAVMAGSSRDLLALLLGRPAMRPLVVTGDQTFGHGFGRAFPGP